MSRTQRKPRSMYGKTRNHRDELIDKDTLEHEQLLFVHGESASGKAIAVSLTGEWADVRYFPRSLCDLDTADPCGGVQRVDRQMRKLVIPIYSVSAPGFLFDEKGLR